MGEKVATASNRSESEKVKLKTSPSNFAVAIKTVSTTPIKPQEISVIVTTAKFSNLFLTQQWSCFLISLVITLVYPGWNKAENYKW